MPKRPPRIGRFAAAVTTARPQARAHVASALDAAAQVLAKAKQPMRAKELIEQMAAEGLWTSPGGKTPEATLYAAMVREIGKKGEPLRQPEPCPGCGRAAPTRFLISEAAGGGAGS